MKNANKVLNNKSGCVLITGGTGIVGTKLIEGLLKANNTVIFTSSSQSKIEKILKNHTDEVEQSQLIPLLIDLESDSALDTIVNFLKKHALFPTGLVNAARSVKHLNFEGSSTIVRDKWLSEFLLDVVVPYELSIALSKMPNSQLESVVNIASMYGVVTFNPHLYEDQSTMSPLNYSVAKAGLIQLTKELAVQLAPTIRVNTVSFGGIVGRVDDAFQARYSQLVPNQRMLAQDEVVAPVLFLLSPGASAVTGHNLIADGGWTIW